MNLKIKGCRNPDEFLANDALIDMVINIINVVLSIIIIVLINICINIINLLFGI